ncbi:MAG: DUF4390 domain-containing protein [Pseudomonadota bacterium]
MEKTDKKSKAHRLKPSLNLKIGIILLGMFLIFSPHAFCQEARLTNIIVTNTRDDLLLYFSVEGAFQQKMKEAILSGVPASFSFYISLYRNRNFWLDKEIADLKITHAIKYNTVKKEFVITRSWENSSPIVTQSFIEAQRLMIEIDSLKILPLKRLEKGNQYQLRAKAELSKLTLPFYLHYILFFVSLWDFETDWYTVDFIY